MGRVGRLGRTTTSTGSGITRATKSRAFRRHQAYKMFAFLFVVWPRCNIPSSRSSTGVASRAAPNQAAHLTGRWGSRAIGVALLNRLAVGFRQRREPGVSPRDSPLFVARAGSFRHSPLALPRVLGRALQPSPRPCPEAPRDRGGLARISAACSRHVPVSAVFSTLLMGAIKFRRGVLSASGFLCPLARRWSGA
jgi:hypothetical protein